MARRKKTLGTVYLIHFATPLSHASHYIGYTTHRNVDRRLADHRKGQGSRLLQVVREKGIRFFVSRVWFDVPRRFERRLKDRKNAKVLCPTCNPNAGSFCRVPNRSKE